MENPHQTQTPLVQENIVSHPTKNPSLPMLLSGVALVTAIVAGGIGYYIGSMQKPQNVLPDQEVQISTTPQSNQVACTMEAKLCPDGSSVGRSGPNCEFTECPSSIGNPSESIDDSSGLKTYSSNIISFKYPDSLILEEREPGFIVLLTDANNPQSVFSSIDARQSGNYANYEDAILSTKNGLTNVQEAKLSNGVKISGKVGPGYREGQQITIALFKYGKAAIEFETTTVDPNQLQIFNDILSTVSIK